MMNQRLIKRREFLKILAVSGAAVGFGSKLLLELIASGELPSYSETRLLMGTWINLTVVSPEGEQLSAVVEATFAEVESLIAVFDHRSPHSEVGQLNAAGRIIGPSPALVQVVEKSMAVAQLTGGAFDITIKPVLDIFQFGGKLTQAVTSLVDYHYVHTASDRIWFERPGVQITLDGIAKGAVVDAGVAVLHNAGYTDVMVEAGGDLMASGRRGGGDPWRIGISHPRQPGQSLIATLGLSNQAAATSGDYQFYFSEDFSQNHILDPELFESPRELASVTVLAPSAMEADAFSTAVTVMGSGRGLALLEELPGIEALVITKEMQIIKSSGFPFEM